MILLTQILPAFLLLGTVNEIFDQAGASQLRKVIQVKIALSGRLERRSQQVREHLKNLGWFLGEFIAEIFTAGLERSQDEKNHE